MQIKRFEADDMTEALRLVKREFGDDAVILSAKEVRPGGFFSALRKKSVEITAATDYPGRKMSAMPPSSMIFPGCCPNIWMTNGNRSCFSLFISDHYPHFPERPSLHWNQPPAGISGAYQRNDGYGGPDT
jgi:hypothetical protein